MTLLDDLQSLDLSPILDARGSITVTVQAPELQAVVDGGAAQAALAEAGASIAALQDSFGEPADLIQPLLDAMSELIGPLSGDALPLQEYVAAVQQGAEIIVQLFSVFDGDVTSWGSAFDIPVSDLLDTTLEMAGRYTGTELNRLPSVRKLFERVDAGVPQDPDALIDLALGILLPFAVAPLRALRAELAGFVLRAGHLSLPAQRTQGLRVALDAVATAAATGDAARLQAALAELERVRAHTIRVMAEDLLRISGDLERLNFAALFEQLNRANDILRSGQEGILEFLENLRAVVVEARAQVNEFPIDELPAQFDALIDTLEAMLQAQIAAPIDAQVERLDAWLRALFRELPFRVYRQHVTDFIHTIAVAIEEADLDRFAREALEALDEVEALISGDIGGAIQDALGEVSDLIDSTLGTIIDQVNAIAAAVTALEAEATVVLERAVAALQGFRETMDRITAAVENLGIEAAQEQVVNTLVELRQTAEELLGIAPLPEPMRPLVEQLIEQLDSIDLAAVFDPVRQTVSESLTIPDSVATTVTESLAAVAEVIENLIPDELITSIDAEINAALDVLRGFDPASLLPDVTAFLDEAAEFLEQLDPVAVADDISEPYDALLEAFDRAHPLTLMQPVISAYEDVLGNVSVPQMEDAVRGVSDTINQAGEQLGRALTEPVQQLVPKDAVSIGNPSDPPPQTVATPPQLESVRPGDLIRVFSYLPDQLRAGVAALDAGVAGDVLRGIDDVCGGLARELRAFQAVIWRVEDGIDETLDRLLLPLAPAQFEAQLAIEAHFGDGDIDLDASLSLVAQAGPGMMRNILKPQASRARAAARRAAGRAAGELGAELERAATALERCRLAQLGSDLDAFLAALDPEPLAAEIDGLVIDMINRGPELAAAINDALQASVNRILLIFYQFNPAVQAQKFLKLADILREEIELLNPRLLAIELAEIHSAVRATLEAYDPRLLAQEIKEVLDAVAAQVRALDPAALLGDLSPFDDIEAAIDAVNPTVLLAGVGADLDAVGAELRALDPSALLAAINDLGPRIIDAIEAMVDAIRDEIIALLESLKYASASASVSVSVAVG
jgi:hypothetical protein